MSALQADDVLEALELVRTHGKLPVFSFLFDRDSAQLAKFYGEFLAALARRAHAHGGGAPNAGLFAALARWARPGAAHRYIAYAGTVLEGVLVGGTADDDAGLCDLCARLDRALCTLDCRLGGGALGVIQVRVADARVRRLVDAAERAQGACGFDSSGGAVGRLAH